MAYKTIDEANQAVIDKMIAAAPFLVDVVPAKSKIPELKENVLLHAGPPIKYENMTDPMQGSCVGAILFEGWADNCLLYTSPSPRDKRQSRMPSSA